MLVEMEPPTLLGKDSRKGSPDNRVSPVGFDLGLAVLVSHERPNNESLYIIVPGTILSISLDVWMPTCRGRSRTEVGKLLRREIATTTAIAGQ